MADEDWEEYGDNFERPLGGGEGVFRVYFKGLVEKGSERRGNLCGIGVAICDSSNELLFELRKPVVSAGVSRQCAELKALIEGLNVALALELKRVVFYCDYYPIFQYVIGRWSPRQQKVTTLVNQVGQLREKFTSCRPSFVARNDIKFAIKLSREAIDSQLNETHGAGKSGDLYEVCAICLEDINVNQIFLIDGCQHRYCYSCMKQHVEAKLLHGIVPKCPHENCNSELKIDSCSKFLTPKLIEMMGQRIKEALIPDADKVYCPYPKCSALMSRNQTSEHAGSSSAGGLRLVAKNCIKCYRLFCMSCKVPWHKDMSCFEYRRQHPFGNEEDFKLKSLAARNLWRQCVKCKHMIELAAGCYHMTCRCGFEFCYTCGAEWENKKATCACPLFEASTHCFNF
ncbi:hypothetical protein Leryth_017105 [Lithospermum erythrorhizon]|nr:hypothetical protein Leryth_017105 [Lithospermum erythrorhizon]